MPASHIRSRAVQSFLVVIMLLGSSCTYSKSHPGAGPDGKGIVIGDSGAPSSAPGGDSDSSGDPGMGGTTGEGGDTGGTTTGGGGGSTTGGTGGGCSADQDCQDPNTQMCDVPSGQCVPRSQPPPAKCTLSGPQHNVDSCPNGFNCNEQTGQCVPSDPGCSSDQECVQKNGPGWTCPELGSNCQPPLPPPARCGAVNTYCSAAVHCCPGLKCDYNTNVCVAPQASCPGYPATYSDGRMAVPLVIEAFRDPDEAGDAATFARDTGSIAMNDEVSSLIIYKGPNYVNMDHVELYTNDDFNNNGSPDLKLYPGKYNLSDHSLDDVISSLRIVRASNLPACADPVTPNDATRWPGKIPVIAEIYEHANYIGKHEQIISDTPTLGKWGLASTGCVWGPNDSQCRTFSDNISAVEVLKGPDYSDGDFVRLFHTLNDWWNPQDGDPHFDASPTDVKSGLYPYVGDSYNDWVANIYFYHQNGKTIGVGATPGVRY